MVAGPAIAASLWFEITDPMITTFGNASKPSRMASFFDIHAIGDIDLATPEKKLANLLGGLSLGRRSAEGDAHLGYIRRDGSNYFAVSIVMDDEHWQQVRELFSWGFRPRRLELEFDVEYEQHFDGESYWDDVRYPSAMIDQYRIDWVPAGVTELRSRHYRG
jgi:hypothetical protein